MAQLHKDLWIHVKKYVKHPLAKMVKENVEYHLLGYKSYLRLKNSKFFYKFKLQEEDDFLEYISYKRDGLWRVSNYTECLRLNKMEKEMSYYYNKCYRKKCYDFKYHLTFYNETVYDEELKKYIEITYQRDLQLNFYNYYIYN